MSDKEILHNLQVCDITGKECPFDERLCRAMHGSIDARLSSMSWIFGIIVTLNLSFFVFTGWLSTRVMNLDIERAQMSEKINMVETRQQQVLSKLDVIAEKITTLAQSSLIRDQELQKEISNPKSKNP